MTNDSPPVDGAPPPPPGAAEPAKETKAERALRKQKKEEEKEERRRRREKRRAAGSNASPEASMSLMGNPLLDYAEPSMSIMESSSVSPTTTTATTTAKPKLSGKAAKMFGAKGAGLSFDAMKNDNIVELLALRKLPWPFFGAAASRDVHYYRATAAARSAYHHSLTSGALLCM
jgi:hypothetical protein